MSVMKSLAALLVLLPLFACASSSGAREERVLVSPRMLEAPSVHSLFGYRERLKLSSEQVATLDSLFMVTRERDRALLDSLRAHSQSLSRSETPLLSIGEQGQPFLEEIRRGHEALEEQVERILSPEQREEACRINRDGREERRGRAGKEGTHAPGAARASEKEKIGERLPQAEGQRWRWCGTAATPG